MNLAIRHAQAQVGHVAPEMMKTYSHIRREALNQAAAALENPVMFIKGRTGNPPRALTPQFTPDCDPPHASFPFKWPLR